MSDLMMIVGTDGDSYGYSNKFGTLIPNNAKYFIASKNGECRFEPKKEIVSDTIEITLENTLSIQMTLDKNGVYVGTDKAFSDSVGSHNSRTLMFRVSPIATVVEPTVRKKKAVKDGTNTLSN